MDGLSSTASWDFECIAAITGQALQWYGPEAGKGARAERTLFQEA